MTTTNFIAAIELGSSKIRGIAGTKNSDGSINILAYADEESSDFIRKGVVYNLDKTSQGLNNIINTLEGKLKSSIAKVYVGASGQSLRSVHNSISRNIVEDDKIVDQNLLDSLNDENTSIPLIGLDILDVAPQEYKVGNNLQADPKGVAADYIEGRFLNIVANQELKKRIEYCFEESKISIADLFVSPLTTANALLSEKEKRAGCALIDFGAHTTTVSIYRDNLLRFLTVIPLGGQNITKDLMTLQIEEDEAEAIKLSLGNAKLDRNGQDGEEGERAIYTLDDGRKIDLEDILIAIEARMEEIVLNAWNQIEHAGYEDKLLAGIILTGGASQIQNLRQLVQDKSSVSQVRIADKIQANVQTSDKQFKSNSSMNTILGLLEAGRENCREIPATDQPNDLFVDDEDLKKQEEEAKKALQEKERAKKEEEAQKAKEKETEKKKETDKNHANRKGLFDKISDMFFSDDDLQ